MEVFSQEQRNKLIAKIGDGLLKGNYSYTSLNGLNVYLLAESPDQQDIIVTIEWRRRGE